MVFAYVAKCSDLLEDDFDAVLEALNQLHNVMLDALSQHQGYQVEHDVLHGFYMLAFGSPLDAIACTVGGPTREAGGLAPEGWRGDWRAVGRDACIGCGTGG